MSADADALREAITDSGEALARAAGRLANAAADDFDAAADVLLRHALDHERLLCRAGAFLEAFATGTMALLTLFRTGRFVPDAHAGAYLEQLLTIGVAASAAAQQAPDAFAAEHLEAIDAELGPLMLASYNKMKAAAKLPPPLAQPFEALADWVDSEATFHGSKITAEMAVDILYDIAARLAALGVLCQ